MVGKLGLGLQLVVELELEEEPAKPGRRERRTLADVSP